ncbi:MAG: hypothetical protein EBT93_07400 [Alphaproteobacteria bacterium]|nr:hypothetical protein [Alphaproteobacteria bacterium]
MIDFQLMFNGALSVLLIIVGWGVRSIYDAINKLKDDQMSLERNLYENYVRRDTYRDDMAEIKDLLGAIWKRLEGKEDKK